MKRGEVYIHRRFVDENRRPLRVRITAVRNGRVYWCPVGVVGKAAFWLTEDDAKLLLRRKTVREAMEDMEHAQAQLANA